MLLWLIDFTCFIIYLFDLREATVGLWVFSFEIFIHARFCRRGHEEHENIFFLNFDLI